MFNSNHNKRRRKMWARPGMQVVFRAEVMPGKTRQERTFKVKEVLENGRVVLEGFPDEYREGAFEPIRFDKINSDKSNSGD